MRQRKKCSTKKMHLKITKETMHKNVTKRWNRKVPKNALKIALKRRIQEACKKNAINKLNAPKRCISTRYIKSHPKGCIIIRSQCCKAVKFEKNMPPIFVKTPSNAKICIVKKRLWSTLDFQVHAKVCFKKCARKNRENWI